MYEAHIENRSSRAEAGALRRPLVLRPALAVLLLLAFFAAPLHAEKADREKPVNLEADRVTVDDLKQTAVFEGNVVLTQGTTVIRGDRMVVKQDAEGFQYGTTYGNLAYFRQKRDGVNEYVEGWAERIEYDGKADRVQMFNRAYLKRNTDEVRGDYISYDAPTEFFRVVGGGKKAATATNPEGRVRAVIQPKSKGKPAPAAPPVTLKPSTNVGSPRETPAPPPQ
jgi:lipopolysaccharide export system protein LptA